MGCPFSVSLQKHNTDRGDEVGVVMLFLTLLAAEAIASWYSLLILSLFNISVSSLVAKWCSLQSSRSPVLLVDIIVA